MQQHAHSTIEIKSNRFKSLIYAKFLVKVDTITQTIEVNQIYVTFYSYSHTHDRRIIVK